MAEKAKDKKYYWLKLKRDFFKRHDIQIIEAMPNGKDYILFYLKMLVESVDHDGELRFSETIPYNESMLATITNTNVDIVKSAMKVFTELGMIEILDDQTVYMAEVNKMLGSETYWAEKKRNQRIGQCPTDVLALSNLSKEEIEKEIEIDIEKEIEIGIEEKPKPKKKKDPPTRHKYGSYNNVLLSDEEYQKLIKEFPKDYQKRIEKLSEYMKYKGKTYSDHLATIRAWARRDEEERPQKTGSKSFRDLEV